MTAGVTREQRWSRTHPCKVCGGWDAMPRGEGKRCSGFASDDGLYARCSREECSGALSVGDDGLYRHYLGGACKCGQPHTPAPVTSTRARTQNAIEATYPYHDENGDLLFEVVRFAGKSFAQRVPDDHNPGRWIWKLGNVRRVLYRLPELLGSSGVVYVTEGEKDADALRKRGLTATTSPHGAGKWRFVAEHAASVLKGRDVVVWADNDPAGRKHASDVERCLRNHAKSIRIVFSQSGKDAHDHFAAGHGVEDVLPGPDMAQQSEPARPPLRLAPAPQESREILLGTDLHRMTDEACEVLAKDQAVFQRGGLLVNVVSVPSGPSSIKRSPDARIIRSLASPTVRERLSAGAAWLKHDARSRTRKPALPPEAVVSAVTARGQWSGVRPLVGVVTSPCLRPDGTVLQTQGYDAATGILYEPAAKYRKVAEQPRLEDGMRALEMLREVVCDFPFASPAHESAWIAGVLTMLARPAIDGPVPLFAIDATTRGTGKSRLVDAASMLAHGHVAARSPLPEDDDEMRKRITTLLLDGDPAILFDNVTSSVSLPSLDAMLTSEMWKDRMLGTMSSITVPVRCVSWLTGNNVALGGDLSRRTIHIRLESPLENPEERAGFRHPHLLDWIRDQRPQLVAAALTILRGFLVAGGYGKVDPSAAVWGSFESWSKLVPVALTWVGMPSPILARATAGSVVDEEKMNAQRLIDGLRKLCPDDSRGRMLALSARHIVDSLYPDRDPREPSTPDGFDDLRDAIEQETRCPTGRKPEARRLGKWLQRVRGRVIDGWSVQRHQDGRGNATWRAEPVAH